METAVLKAARKRNNHVNNSVKTLKSISEEDIRRRAYEIYLDNGDDYSDAMEDWLRAERELTENSD